MREAVIIEAVVVVVVTIRWHRSHHLFPGILQVVVVVVSVASVAVTSSHQGPAEVVVVAITSNTEDLLVMEAAVLVVATNDLRGGRSPRTMATVEAAGAVTSAPSSDVFFSLLPVFFKSLPLLCFHFPHAPVVFFLPPPTQTDSSLTVLFLPFLSVSLNLFVNSFTHFDF